MFFSLQVSRVTFITMDFMGLNIPPGYVSIFVITSYFKVIGIASFLTSSMFLIFMATFVIAKSLREGILYLSSIFKFQHFFRLIILRSLEKVY